MGKKEIIEQVVASDFTLKKAKTDKQMLDEWTDGAIEKSHKWLPHSQDITELATRMDDDTLLDIVHNEIDDWLDVVPFTADGYDISPAKAIVKRLREKGYNINFDNEHTWKEISYDEGIEPKIDAEIFWTLYDNLVKKIGFKLDYKTIKQFAKNIVNE